MVAKNMILASLSAVMLYALPVFANERLQGFFKCTSPTSECDVVPCDQTWGASAKATCNDKCSWPETRQAACCAYGDWYSDLYCTEEL
ncbi:hypothetical protein QTJ16_001789 [Diplocarpon rosae]|uniref:Uncharacterized protein n=1 Tax=Diplocarpon rosae TaxID=946125 RepID=A0AAD9T395_9HELO